MSNEQLAANFKQIQALTQKCMRLKGWTYVPEPYANIGSPNSFVPDYVAEDLFLLEFGYGISVRPTEKPRAPSPNEVFQAGLSPTDQEKFGSDLNGVQSTDGCLMRSFRQVYKGSILTDTKFQAGLSNLEQRIQSNPEVKLAKKSWQACMLKAGLKFQSRDDAINSIAERLSALKAAKKANDSKAGEGPKNSGSQELEALTRDERFTAATDVQCEKKFLRPVRESVRRTLLVKLASQRK